MNYPIFSDEYFMNEALKEAQNAFDKDEIPVGAVVVSNNKIIARAHNMTESLTDVTAHAEMIAITAAENYLGSKFLNDCIMYVSLEPCLMCIGALYWSKTNRIVYGTNDSKRGFMKMETLANKNADTLIHPKTEIKTGVLEHECSLLIKNFFKNKR